MLNINPEVEREVCETYYDCLSVQMTALRLKMAIPLVNAIVEDRYGRKTERFRPGTELAKRKAQKQREAANEAKEGMTVRQAKAALNREMPDDLCRRYLGSRFWTDGKGAYYLDGRLCGINERMREVSRERQRRGEPQRTVPEWQI